MVMIPDPDPPRLELRADLVRHTETAAIVDAALAGLDPPPGWRVLRTPGRLEARWEGPDDRWAELSVRFTARGDAAGTVSLAVTCSDHSDETLAVALDFITPLQRRLARALEA
jgi:hypothetical protein